MATTISSIIDPARNSLWIALDYQLNFRPDPWVGDSVADVHNRSARTVFELLRANGGLYLKIGQAIAMQSAILPPEFQKMFARMFDDAPQNTWREVETVIKEDFGKSVEEVFGISFSGDADKGVMERTARASASVAQVHWARLPDGREVAIKIQKKEIARQVGWDLWSFRVVSKIYSWWFDLPLYHLVPYICDRLMAETDFRKEADNSRQMRKLIQGEPRLRDRVYIPAEYPELSSKRVMTAEWIEGVRLWDKEGVESSWKGGWRKGSPGAGGAQLPPPPPPSVKASIRANNPDDEKLKPKRDHWRGASGKGGLGLSFKPVMQTMVDLFSAQMFLWGLVHCDPHPGNIFIRRLPSGKPELVLIDHGLYIQMSPKFRREYALFWRSLMTFDNKTMAKITEEEWGVDAPDIFASATLMRPYQGGDNKTMEGIKKLSKMDQKQRQFEMQQRMRRDIRDILANQDKFPQELIFIGRNLRIVQGNNQFLGSPVNRIKITGYWASRALTEDREARAVERWKEYGKHCLFRFVLFATDLWFYWAKFRQAVGVGKGMDDDIEESMKKMAEGIGVELQHGVAACQVFSMILRVLSLGLVALGLVQGQTQTQNFVLRDPEAACEGIAREFQRENVTVNFSRYIAAGTNVSLDQSTPELRSCTRPSQVVPVDLCRVAMYVSTSSRSGITLEAWLPTNWTGRFLSTGNGGLNGCLQYEDVAYGTSFGFATVGANNGHNGTRGLAFKDNPDVMEDFAWRSLYTETVVGKEITKAYYSKQQIPGKSYYIGCSTGGRQGFKMVQDWPQLFDGVLVGAPALAFDNLTSWSGHFLPITGSNTSDTFVSPDKWALVHQDILKQCDALDGVKDGILEDPTLCSYKPVSLQCSSTATNTSNCLTAKQVVTVQRVFEDYYGKNGALIFPRMQPGSELASSHIEYNGQPFPYTEDWFRYAILNDPTWNASTLNASTAAYAAAKNPFNIESWNGDLFPFAARGGKILHYHGQMDSIITSANSPRYYDHVAATMSQSPSELDEFYRFFRIGGMDHCTGGLGAYVVGQEFVAGSPFQDAQHNVLRRIIEWVEEGKAPESITGVRFVNDTVALGVDFERRHCRYPLRNECVDPDNYKDVESWRCVP
ncbi:putative feruloyl esterase B-2 [Fulvia fulva]|uniref:Carboxylic ester hydrolase n=1 Tax=Passalora fulva TaxID=5499 RepID=A0A9Q8PMM4_PASFU|nr:putative feruloyl esterase B-2 [Fulvia fulva]UJO25326.1 putative feruloyl esterase B-2 [Fulvia fulva]WPV22806.1 putative feruloyl esterase B-2 [Fulvia fulva]